MKSDRHWENRFLGESIWHKKVSTGKLLIIQKFNHKNFSYDLVILFAPVVIILVKYCFCTYYSK